MPYDLSRRLVVGVASSALFDLTESDTYFREHGEAAYREYQDEHVDDMLAPGVAFGFVKRLLGLNELQPDDPLVEVVVMSRNEPVTGLRVMRSIAAHGLAITRAAFTRGRPPYEVIDAYGMKLFLSANRDDVVDAIAAGHPAGYVMGPAAPVAEPADSLYVAFDFDGVLADDSSERVYRSSDSLEPFIEHEVSHVGEVHAPGPLHPLLLALSRIQDVESRLADHDPAYVRRLRIGLVTARSAPAHERAVASLRSWGVYLDDAFFLGGVEKALLLSQLKPDIFFDDQAGHLGGAVYGAAVHIPYGVANE